MCPNRRASIEGSTWRAQAKAPRAFTPMTRSNRFISVSATGRQ
jgi:hypothetical protein